MSASRAELLVPPAVKPGDRIRVIAPSSPFDRTLVLRGIGWLGQRFRVEFDWRMFTRQGFLAGSDERRLQELNLALRDPGVAAIVAARGGYGLTRIAHHVDVAAWLQHPKWLVGFSDITALHVEAWRAGIASLHGENAAGLGRGDAAGRQRFLDALERPHEQRRYSGLETWTSGVARGPLVGGNLTLLFTAAASQRLTFPASAIVLLEDVTETSYRIDRMLSALIASGAFDGIAAIVLGDFTDCSEGQHRVSTSSVLRERLCELGIPIARGLPFGHDVRNDPIAFGARAELDATRGTLTIRGFAS